MALDQIPRINGFILNSERGEPYTDAKGLSALIRRTLEMIGVKDHSGHGLRVTAACALKEAGCEDDMVAAITGHTEHGSAAQIPAGDRPAAVGQCGDEKASCGGWALIMQPTNHPSAKPVNTEGPTPAKPY